MRLTKNFTLSEFDCRDGSVMPPDVFSNVVKLAKELQVLRDFIGKSIIINSGYRSPDYNRSIGGASRSQHLLGKAADIRVDGISPRELRGIIEELIKDKRLNFKGIGAYANFTHVDIRDKKARWNG